jgi:hypothetical protein
MATPNTSATRQTLEDSYDLKKHTLVTRKRQSDTEDYAKNNRTGRRTTPRAPWHSRGKGSQKPLPNTPVFCGLSPS